MLVAKWIDTYVIHQWREFRSSYRKLSWLVHEPTTTEFGSEALTDWALRPWVQLTLRANVVQLLQFHLFVLCSRFISLFTLARHDLWFKPNLLLVIMLKAEWIDSYGSHHWRIFRSSYWKLARVRFEPTTTDFLSEALTDWALTPSIQLAITANFVQLLQFHLILQWSCFILLSAFVIGDICFKPSVAQIFKLVGEWNDTYTIHHWRIFRSSYTNFRWVRFEPNTTDFESDVLTDWAIRRWVQLALRTSFVQLSNFLSLLSNHALFLSLSSSGATFALSQVSYW